MSHTRGKSAEYLAISWMMEQSFMNWEIFMPTAEDGPVDLVWRRLSEEGVHGAWESAQVKRVYRKGGLKAAWKDKHPTINLVRADGQRYGVRDADYLIAVEPTLFGVGAENIWMIPFHLVAHLTRLRLGKKWDKYRVWNREEPY